MLEVVAQMPPPRGLIPDLPHAWSEPYLYFFDTYRVLTVICDLYLLYFMSFASFLAPTRMQRALIISFCMSLLLGMWSQLERLGETPSWRLVPITICTASGLYGVYKYISTYTPKEHRHWWWIFRPPVMDPPSFPPTGKEAA